MRKTFFGVSLILLLTVSAILPDKSGNYIYLINQVTTIAWADEGTIQETDDIWKLFGQAIADNEYATRMEKLGRLREKVASLIKANPTQGNLAEWYTALAMCNEQSYRFPDAIKFYDILTYLYPRSKYVPLAKYKAELLRNNYQSESEVLRLYVEQDRLRQAGNYEAAVGKCQEIAFNYPKYRLAEVAQNAAGYIYFNYLKKYNLARDEYEKLMRNYSKSLYLDNAIFPIGRCFEELGLYQSATVYYKYLKDKHSVLGYPKTEYQSRIWATKADERLNLIQGVMESLKQQPPKYKLVKCEPLRVWYKRGNLERIPLDIRSWVRPGESRNILENKSALSDLLDPEQGKILGCWNYILGLQYYNLLSHEFWQYPQETFQKKAGNCYDLSFALASLLIAQGISPDNVRVKLGQDAEGNNHAWVDIKHKGEWYLLETKWRLGQQDELYLSKYEGYIPGYSLNNQLVEKNPEIGEVVLKAVLDEH